jgi:hypothetical protein
MTTARSIQRFVIPAFLLGFVLGGVSFHVASAEGLFGIKDSVTQIGTSLVEMQKNVDALQKNMNTLKQTKDKLSSLPSGGGAMDSIMRR